jgi:hypothetical protein
MTGIMGKPLYSIQVVRAVAATLVIITHIGRSVLLKVGTDVTYVTALGSAGVDLFFVVSGFIMVHTTTWPFHAGLFIQRCRRYPSSARTRLDPCLRDVLLRIVRRRIEARLYPPDRPTRLIFFLLWPRDWPCGPCRTPLL